MKITVDTNVLVRAVVRDDKKQAQAAARILKDANLIAVPLPCLCEFVWVLRRVYGFGQLDVAAAIEALVDAANVVVNRPAVDAGLAVLKAGGDFADGLIAQEGNW
ncbi:MAG: type II toxin-antitoxin system VapC family toxin, partial [Silvibacterium sp.]